MSTGVCHEHGKVMLHGDKCRECRERDQDILVRTFEKDFWEGHYTEDGAYICSFFEVFVMPAVIIHHLFFGLSGKNGTKEEEKAFTYGIWYGRISTVMLFGALGWIMIIFKALTQ